MYIEIIEFISSLTALINSLVFIIYLLKIIIYKYIEIMEVTHKEEISYPTVYEIPDAGHMTAMTIDAERKKRGILDEKTLVQKIVKKQKKGKVKLLIDKDKMELDLIEKFRQRGYGIYIYTPKNECVPFISNIIKWITKDKGKYKITWGRSKNSIQIGTDIV